MSGFEFNKIFAAIILAIIIIGRITGFHFILELSRPLFYFYSYVFNLPYLINAIYGN